MYLHLCMGFCLVCPPAKNAVSFRCSFGGRSAGVLWESGIIVERNLTFRTGFPVVWVIHEEFAVDSITMQ